MLSIARMRSSERMTSPGPASAPWDEPGQAAVRNHAQAIVAPHRTKPCMLEDICSTPSSTLRVGLRPYN
jgi:hypothetical protein